MNARVIAAGALLITLEGPLGCARAQGAFPSAAPEGDPFRQDVPGALSEAELRQTLQAPVVIEPGARVGVLPVGSRLAPDESLPLAELPGQMAQALEASGVFESASEVVADWPVAQGTAGLRELAARYRVSYLLLVRERFAEDWWTNSWGWLIPTVIGGLVAPHQTLCARGVVEATLFDVRSGSLMFTAIERVEGTSRENVWDEDRKARLLEEGLLARATDLLAARVVSKARRLEARSAEGALPTRAGDGV